MHFNFYGEGLTGLLTKLFSKDKEGVQINKPLRSVKDLNTFETFLQSQKDPSLSPSIAGDIPQWTEQLTPEVVNNIKNDFSDESPLSLLSSDEGTQRLTDSIQKHTTNSSISKDMTQMYYLEQLENLANSDRYKIPERETLKNIASEFDFHKREALVDVGEKPIIETPDYVYKDNVSELGNAFLRTIDTFNLPDDVRSKTMKGIEATGQNTELQGLIIGEALKHSNLLNRFERYNSEGVLPTTSVLALSDAITGVINHGKMLSSAEKFQFPIDRSNLPDEIKPYTNHDQVKSYSLISKLLNTEDQNVLNENITDALTEYGINKGERPKSILDAINNKYTPVKSSQLIDRKINIKNNIYDRLEDPGERQLAHISLLDKTVGIEPTDSMLKQVTKIVAYLKSHYDSTLLKHNSIFRDGEIDSLNHIYDTLEKEGYGKTREELNNVMNKLLISAYDDVIPENIPKSVHDAIRHIKEVNLNLSHEISKEFENISGIKTKFQSGFYYRQQWSQGRIKERVASILGKDAIDKITFEPDSEGEKALESLGKTFYSLLDLRKMENLKEEEINVNAKHFSKDRQDLAERLRLTPFSERFKVKADYADDLVKKLDPYKNRRKRRYKGDSKSKQNGKDKPLSKGESIEHIKKTYNELVKRFGINERTESELNELRSMLYDNSEIVGSSEYKSLLKESIHTLLDTVNEEYTFDHFMRNFKELAVGDPLTKINPSTHRGISIGDRQFHFLDGDSYNKALQTFSDQDTMLESLMLTTDSQIKKLTLLKTGFPEGVDFRTLYEAFKNVHGITNERNKEKINLFTRSQMGITLALLDNMYNSYPYVESFPKNKWLGMLDAFTSLSSLGGLYNTVLSSDSVGKAMLTNKGLVNTLKGFIDYFKKVHTVVPEEVMRATVISRDNIFMNENRSRETMLDKTYKFLDKVWGITDLDTRGKFATTYALIQKLTEELTEGTEGLASKVLREKGMSDKHFNFLRDNLESLVYDDSTGRTISLRGFYDHPLLKDVEGYVYNSVSSVIPSRGLLSKSIQAKTSSSNIPVFNIVLNNFMRFAGITTEQMYHTGIEPIILNKTSDFVKSRYTVIALMESALYHIMRSIAQGKYPNFYDDDGKISPSKISIFLKDVIGDSPLFGVFGGILASALNGEMQSMLGSRVLGGYQPLFKAVEGLGNYASGDFGKGSNKLLTASNAINPIRNVPGVGFLFDRMILDSVRSSVYDKSDQYFNSLKKYADDDSQGYLIAPGDFYKSQEELDDGVAKEQQTKTRAQAKKYKEDRMSKLGISKKKDPTLQKPMSKEELIAYREQQQDEIDRKLNQQQQQ